MKSAYCFELQETYPALYFQKRDDAYNLNYRCPVCFIKLYPCAMSEGYIRKPYFKIDSKNPHQANCEHFNPKSLEEPEEGKGKAAILPKIPTHFVVKSNSSIVESEEKPTFIGTEKSYKASPTNPNKVKNLKETDFSKMVRAYIEHPFDRDSKLTILNTTKTYKEYFLEAELAFSSPGIISVYRGKLSFKRDQLNYNKSDLTIILVNKSQNGQQISIKFDKNKDNIDFFKNLLTERDKIVTYAQENRTVNPNHYAYVFVLGSSKKDNSNEINVYQNYVYIDYLDQAVFKTPQ